MTRGRSSAVLSEKDRHRLRLFQRQHEKRLGVGVGLPQLRAAMEAPFSWETLQRALRGEPIVIESRTFILAFLDRVMPAPAPPVDYKARASGERDEEEEPAVTHRGSR